MTLRRCSAAVKPLLAEAHDPSAGAGALSADIAPPIRPPTWAWDLLLRFPGSCAALIRPRARFWLALEKETNKTYRRALAARVQASSPHQTQLPLH